MSQEKIDLLKQFCDDAELTVPSVQRINESIFVVKTEINRNFPAGLLHVRLNKFNEPYFVCACKKLKIILSPNCSVSMENDKCDHILLIYAAILSSEELAEEFSMQINEMVTYFDVRSIDAVEFPTSDEGTNSVIDFQNLTTTIETSLPHESVSMPTTTIENLEDIELIQVPNPIDENNTILDYENGASLDQFYDESGDDFHPLNIDNIRIVNDESTATGENLESLELIDCHVELMDQFKLAECANEICFGDGQEDYFDSNTIYDMSLAEWNCVPADSTFSQDDIYMNDVEQNDNIVTGNDSPGRASIISSTYNGTIDTSDNETNQIELDLFINWLDSIIERINLTMNFAGDGRPEPLVFSIPQVRIIFKNNQKQQ